VARTRVAAVFLHLHSSYARRQLFCCTQNDADTADPDSLCDDAAEKIGDLEQKLALANASNEMFEEEIRRLKSIIEGQSQDIERLNEGKKKKDKEQAHHLEAKISEYRKKYVTLFEEKDKLEEKLARQKKELATLNKKVELAVLNKKAIFSTSNKGGSDSSLMARIERQKKELARLNKQVENKKAKELWDQLGF
jgi:chromosome segregation ATPase